MGSSRLTTRSCEKPIVKKPAETFRINGPENWKRPRKFYSFGSWNVRSLFRTGSIKTLLTELTKYKLDIVAIQESKLLGKEIMDMKTHTIFKSGKIEGNREFGTAFIVNKKLIPHVKDFKPVDERICALRIRAKFANIWLINAHAPTEEKYDSDKDDFYSRMELLYDSLLINDVKIALGDFNSKVGNEEIHRGTTGGHSLHENSNEMGTG